MRDGKGLGDILTDVQDLIRISIRSSIWLSARS
jgi:hypothetical protein